MQAKFVCALSTAATQAWSAQNTHTQKFSSPAAAWDVACKCVWRRSLAGPLVPGGGFCLGFGSCLVARPSPPHWVARRCTAGLRFATASAVSLRAPSFRLPIAPFREQFPRFWGETTPPDRFRCRPGTSRPLSVRGHPATHSWARQDEDGVSWYC